MLKRLRYSAKVTAIRLMPYAVKWYLQGFRYCPVCHAPIHLDNPPYTFRDVAILNAQAIADGEPYFYAIPVNVRFACENCVCTSPLTVL